MVFFVNLTKWNETSYEKMQKSEKETERLDQLFLYSLFFLYPLLYPLFFYTLSWWVFGTEKNQIDSLKPKRVQKWIKEKK